MNRPPWTTDEDAVVERIYPANGPQATHAALAARGHHRSLGSVRTRAHALGIRHRAIGTDHGPTLGPPPSHRLPAWSIWPPTFTDVLDIHPLLADAFIGDLVDHWQPVAL